jgi:predicted MFS family arabinose efflux permease
MAVNTIAEMPKAFSNAYKGWVLFLIFLMTANNYVDRSIMSVVSQPLKADLHISDTGIGLLGGTGFALLYVFMGIPLARVAERHSRVSIMSITLVIWSGMTVLCGTARSFIQMFVFRIGVGIGEAGATPTALSLIGDYFPPERRATAISTWSFGNTVGVLIGVVVGGWLTQHFGWRLTFMIVGAPGILLAFVIKLTMAEPPRGLVDSVTLAPKLPSLVEALRVLFSKPTFVHIAIAGGIANFAIQGIALFVIAYYVRRFHVHLADAAFLAGLVSGGATTIGVLIGGSLSDWAGRHDKRWYAWIPAIGLAAAAPLYAIGFLQTSWTAAVLTIAPIGAVLYIFHAPYVALALNVSPPDARATAASVLVFFAAAIGLGLGPVAVGWLSDTFSAHAFAQGPEAFIALCDHGIAGQNATPAVAKACMMASARGLQMALLATCLLFVWSAAHFTIASRYVRRDLVVQSAQEKT